MRSPNTETMPPPASRENVMAVYRRIRKMILSGQLKSGQALSQVQLAVDFATSRGPVREALRMLQREGLIEAEANQKGRIVSFTPADLEEVCALLVFNAAMAIRLGEGRFTDSDRTSAIRVIDRIESLAASSHPHVSERRRLAFRRLITLLCRHAGPHARQLIDDLLDRMAMFRQLYAMVSGVPPYPLAHRLPDLRTACERGDAREMSIILVRKIADVSRKALIYLNNHYEPALLDSYVHAALAEAHSLGTPKESPIGQVNPASGHETLTITVRGIPGGGLAYTISGTEHPVDQAVLPSFSPPR